MTLLQKPSTRIKGIIARVYIQLPIRISSPSGQTGFIYNIPRIPNNK